MPEDKKTYLTTGNAITIGVILVGIISTWAGIKSHMSDDTIHVQETEVKLTSEEYKNLLNFATTVQNEFPTIGNNEERIVILELNQAVHRSEYVTLYNEHEGLESKHSRDVSKLNDEINE